ncbi:MAG: GTP cyclohydrolase FolE2 [Myxococcota bacterium]
MEDVQQWADGRGVPLSRVGVSGLRYPIVVLDRANAKQQTTGEFSLSVALPECVKGTHMSRFVEVLNDNRGEVTIHTIPHILDQIQTRLGSHEAQLRIEFDYFLERAAPVSGSLGLMDYRCSFDALTNERGVEFSVGVTVPVTSLCPCSKEISDYGAHNQRGLIELAVRTGRDSGEIVWIEELIEVAERSASCPVYPLLKRADERHVTMKAYDNPVFVEDMVRNAALELRDDPRVTWFRVRAENAESIHNHSAFAETSWTEGAW